MPDSPQLTHHGLTVTPTRDRVVVRLLPSPKRSAFVEVVETETPIRRAQILAVGPEAKNLTVGQTVLCNVMSGQLWGDTELILPSRSILATWIEEE